MRRLWAYFLLAFTSLVLVGVAFSPLLKSANSNIDYQSGREIIFHIENKDGNDTLTEQELKDQLQDTANTMKERLANQDVTRYEITTQGTDTISLILSQDYEQQYTNIVQYMEFDGSFALLNSAGTYALADEFLVEGQKASLETYNNYPCIVLPVNTEHEKYKSVLEGAKGEGAKPETSGEGDDATETYYLYLWYGFEEKLITPETDYATDSHTIMKFTVTGDEETQYFPNTDDKLYSVLNLDSDGDGVASQNEKEKAFDTAKFYVNLLNASKLDVTIKNVGSNHVSAWVEDLISLQDKARVAISPTFIALLAGIALVSVLLVYFFRLGSVSVIVTTIVSMFAGLASMILLTAEFTTITIFAFVALATASLASGTIHLIKIKNEAYRGRSLKKANSEGAKKALLPVIDVNAILIIIGVFCYILGGAAMRTFAVITVMGGIASLILNTLGLRLMLWMAFNATCVQGKYGLFGIDGDKVPDLINEEKQTYFGPYADRDLTKSKGRIGIAGGIVLLATTVAMIVFGVMNGNIYANKANNHNDRLFFETEMSENSQINDDNIRTILGKTYTFTDANGNGAYDEGETKTTVTAKYGIQSIDTTGKKYTLDDKNDEEITYYVTYVTFNSKIDEKALFFYEGNEAYVGDLEEVISNAVRESRTSIVDTDATISFKAVSSYAIGEPDVLKIALSTLLGVGVAGLYLMLRYRLSRGLTAMLLSISAGSIALGLLSLIHLPVVGGYVAVITPLASLFAYIIAILFMNKERELILEDKSKDNSLENRKALAVKATSLSYVAITTFALLAIVVGIVMFGFGSASSALTFVALILAMLIALVVIPVIIGPVSNLFYALFSRVQIQRPTKKKKVKAKKITKSAEPEEAVFIGIND